VTEMSVLEYARLRDVPASTVFDAVSREKIIARDGKVNVEDADAGWFADRLLRKKYAVSLAEYRERGRNASVVEALARVSTLTRQIQAIREATAPREKITAAAGRRAERLRAAFEALPALYAAEAAENTQLVPTPQFRGGPASGDDQR
jgi:hypothetical protein